MDAARREKKEHGTLAFPFQIYPALDGSEADDSDFIPYHWHPELEIITVDAGHVSLTIADHTYEGTHGDVFFAAGEELHEIRAAGRENQFRSFVFAADFLQFSRADQSEFALLSPLAEGRLRFGTCIRAGEPGQNEIRALLAQIVRAWQVQAPGCQLGVKAALLGIVQHGAGDAVLYAARGVKIFDLGQQVCLQAARRGKALQLHERRVADKFGNAGIDFHKTGSFRIPI